MSRHRKLSINSIFKMCASVSGIVFAALIIQGILGAWISPGWAFSTVFALTFIVFSSCEWRKKGFKKSTITVLACFLILFPFFSLAQIWHNHNIAQNLATTENINYFKNLLGRNYNYTELIQWEQANIKWNSSSSMQVHTDPIKIYEYGQARCGGYAILYVTLCLSQGYEARMVVNIFGDHAWAEIKLNNTWTRVDPSPTGAPISDNIGYPLFYEERWRTPPILVLAFDGSSIVDVTSNYRSDGWSLLSLATVIFVFMSIWFAICISIIWKFLFQSLRDSFIIERKRRKTLTQVL